MCVRDGLQSKLYTSQQCRRQGGGTGGTFPPNPENLQGWETARAESASSEPREQQKKFKFLLILLKILLNFSKTFKFFLKNFQNCQ